MCLRARCAFAAKMDLLLSGKNKYHIIFGAAADAENTGLMPAQRVDEYLFVFLNHIAQKRGCRP